MWSSSSCGALDSKLNVMRTVTQNDSELSEFRKGYLQFAKILLEETSKRQRSAGQQEVLIQDFQFSDGDYSIFSRPDSQLERFIPSPEEEVFPKAIASKCAEVFYLSGLASGFKLSNNDGAPIENPSLEKLRPFIVHMALDYPIRHLVQKSGRTSFTKRQVLACLDRYISYWSGKASTDPEYAPIFNLSTEAQIIKLDEFVSIFRFSDEEKTQMMRALSPLERAIDLRNYASASHVARLKPISGSFGEDEKREIRRRARKALQCAITSLRLLKLQGVGTMGFVRCPSLTGNIGAGFSPLEDVDLPWNRMSRFREPYVLDRVSLRRFRRIYHLLSASQLESENNLGLLLRQFNRSCQRERDNDRILDYVICLESALLWGIKNELSYRLALRAAKLLGSRRDPKEIFGHIQCLYKVRSKIVHGNQPTSGAAIEKETMKIGVPARDFMRETDVLVRDLLSEIIQRVSRQGTFEILCKDLDDEIVSSL